MTGSVFIDRRNMARRGEGLKCEGGASDRRWVVSLVCLIALVAMMPALPAAAQSAQDLIKRNEALVNQNKALMEQNRQLMEMVQKNATRIGKLESTVSSGTAGAAKGGTIKLEERVKKLETKQAAVAKQPAGLVKSGNKKVRLSLSGQINRGILVSDDGNSSDVFHVDNDNSSTRFRFVGEADMGKWTLGTNFEVEFESNSTADVNQNTDSNSPTLKERKIEFYVGHAKYGKLTVGQGDTASNNTSEVDLSGTGVIGYSSISDMAGGLLFYDDSANALSTTNIGSVSTNFDGLSRDDRVRYDTPDFYGFSVAASAISNDKYDAAVFFNRKFGNFKTAAAFGASNPQGTVDHRLNGSASVLHSSGFNATFAAGQDSEESSTRNDPWSVYGKLGYLIDWDKHKSSMMKNVGKTALAVDYQYVEDKGQNDDEFKSVGVFVVQNVDDWAAELYVGLRWHDLDRTATDYDSIFAALIGGRVKF